MGVGGRAVVRNIPPRRKKKKQSMEQTIVLYPFPEIGHLVSMVELGKLILHHYPKTSITILLVTGPFNTPGTTSYIRSISRTHPSISFYDFPPLDAPSPPPTWSHAARWFSYINSNAPNVLNSLREISKTSAVRALVIDLFCTSALAIGKEFSIPTYYFFTSGAAILAAYLYFPKIHEQTTLSFKDMKDTVFSFPGLPPIKATHMVEPTLDREDPAYYDMLHFFSNLPKSDGILVNTFEELEPKAVSVLDSGMCAPDSKIPPVYYMGPLLAPRSKDDASLKEIDCLSWLERQPSRSVVFLCFGSRGSFSAAQVKEIAVGLEMSSLRFLWVVKSPPPTEGSKQNTETTEFDLDSLLPDGFLERTKERGLVVKRWAPQVAVLSQESVGGFVTHCGWNSVLEAVVAGVPMVAWPLYAEQHMNRTYLVEQMEMAIPLDQREEDGFVTAAELEKRLRELMDSENGQQLRQKSQEMKEKALDARGESASSTRALAKLIQIWQEG